MARKFAYGANELADVKSDGRNTACGCPATTAGKSVTGPVLQVAEQYDSLVRSQTGEDEGIIPRKMADECWTKALQRLRDRVQMCDDPQEREYLATCIGAGEDVQEEVFNG